MSANGTTTVGVNFEFKCSFYEKRGFCVIVTFSVEMYLDENFGIYQKLF